MQGLIGLAVLTLLAWAASENRAALAPRRLARIAGGGIALQVVLALLLTRVPILREGLVQMNDLVRALGDASQAGTSFVFGYLGGDSLPFVPDGSGSSFILAFQALPIVLLMSALTALLFHWGILQRIVRGFAWVLHRTMNMGGAVGLSAAANVFVGMVEAPLMIRPYLRAMPRSGLFKVMTVGMATVAGTVLALYASILDPVLENAAGHILVASLLSAPAALMIAELMVPDGKEADAEPADGLQDDRAFTYDSSMDAITRGTLEGARLMINILALLIVLVALVHLANGMLSLLPAVWGEPLTLQRILGWLFAPLVWTLGIPWAEAPAAGSLMGIKTVLNELLAYLALADLPPEALGERSRLILSYALCGFANLGSLGIMIGGLAGMVPERRSEIVSLGSRSIVSGTLATCMTGAVIGLVQ